jgi:23S rRNA (cytidine2498-2'-O)-methyltransferase
MESALIDEVGDRAGIRAVRLASGLVTLEDCRSLPPVCFCFERQRMPDAGFIPDQALKPIGEDSARAVLGFLPDAPRQWTMHAHAVEDGLGRRVAGIAGVMRRLAAEMFPGLAGLELDPLSAEARDSATVAVQLCLTPAGLCHSVSRMDRLSDRFPGGVVRMPDDPLAPSRSAMKIEEVFLRMGYSPRGGQKAVDLGAAPGGWTWAMARRGCRVLAVDHGPMRLPGGSPAAALVKHVKDNGITFRPPESWLPVDWFVSDMLVPPGVTFGLIRRWLAPGMARRFVCNIKMPQVHPWRAIGPLVGWLESQRRIEWTVRQLYHDRREVTLYGRVR